MDLLSEMIERFHLMLHDLSDLGSLIWIIPKKCCLKCQLVPTVQPINKNVNKLHLQTTKNVNLQFHSENL